MRRLFFFILLFSIANLNLAQPDYDIEDVEVVSLQIPVSVEESGRSVTIIKADEIARLPFTSVDEVLRYLPGVNVNSRGGFGVQTDLGMRGSTFTQVLVLIDGVRFSEPLTAHLNFSLPIPLNEIAQIEVIRGPASAMYGADAVGGLIHIKTKTYLNKVNAGLVSTGNLYYGKENLLDGDVALSYKKDRLTISGGYKLTQSDGEQFINPNFLNQVSDQELYRTDFDIDTYTFSANYQPNTTWTINGRYAKDERDFNAKHFYTTSDFDESRETTGNELVQFSASRTSENSKTTLSAAYRQGEDFFLFNPAFAANDHTTNRYIGLLQHQITNKDQVTFGFGVQAEKQEIESTDRGNHDQENIEAFASTLIPIQDVTIMLSQRMGMNEDYGVNYTPQASVSYNKDRYMLRSSAGWAVRAPDFTERYTSNLIPQLSGGRNLGNPTLQAEESLSIDFGGTYLATENIKLSSSIFYRNSQDLVDYVLTDESEIATASNLIEGESYLYATNIGEATTTGLEMEGSWVMPISGNNHLRVTADYTYIDTNIEGDIDSKYLANHPTQQFNLNSMLQYNQFSVSITSQYVDRRAEAIERIGASIQDNYFLGHLKLGYEVHSDIRLQLRYTNVFDTNYQEILGAQMPGRWLSGGFQWNLGSEPK